MDAVQIPVVAPPVIEPVKGIPVFKQVAGGPDAEICTAGSTLITLENVLKPHSFSSINV